jgi:hypothetical protein
MRDMHETVQAEVSMTFLVSTDLSFRIPVGLRYDSEDPYAVEIVFHLPGDAPVRWTFARELLLDGLSKPSGEGDVHIAPPSPERLSDVFITLRVGDERALFRAGAAPLVAFLDRTDRLVQFGEEAAASDSAGDLDAVLDRILAEDRYAG